MTDLQKDQAIYNEMLQIANEVFNSATENNEALRKYMNENGGVVSINDITKARSEVYSMIDFVTKFNDTTKEGLRTVTVDTFTCSFPPMRVFESILSSLTKKKSTVSLSARGKSNSRMQPMQSYLQTLLPTMNCDPY